MVGTGDLSELALGWCTYGVGDQMSHYGVNASVPKTLIQYLVRWVADTEPLGAGARDVLMAILDTEISPELVPSDAPGERPHQHSEDFVGPYELQDFHLYHVLRFGYRPSKVAFLAHQAWGDRDRGRWPDTIAVDGPPRVRPGRDLPLASRVPAALLRDQPVQAVRAARRPQGRLRRILVASRRLARAERRHGRALARGPRRARALARAIGIEAVTEMSSDSRPSVGPNPLVRDLRIETLSDEQHTLRRARYELQQQDGRWDPVSREAYDPGDATAALVVDPTRGTILLVRQYRLPAHLNGHPDGMLLEAPAGKIDDGETPEATMRRELVEELGHKIERLDLIVTLYSTPGSVTERLWLFTGEYSDATKVAPGGGEDAESERLDIVELTLDDALGMVADGHIVDMKTVVLLQWMRRDDAAATRRTPPLP